MPAAYDTYDYPSYWEGRDYEHQSEVIALRSLLNKVEKINLVLDLGAGYGRLTPTYFHRCKRAVLTDPSMKLLGRAIKEYKKDKKIRCIQGKAENIGKKIKGKSADLVIMVRVMHHLKNPEEIFKKVNRVLKPGGYFILEFANKSHGKAVFNQICKGNLTYILDIFPIDIRSAKFKKKKTLPFVNYHPDIVDEMLKDAKFQIIEKRSVSNIRSDRLKKLFSLDLLLKIEKMFQKPLSFLNFGPSIFILSKKIG